MVKHIVQKGRYRHAFAQQGKYPGKPAVRLITDIGLFAVNGILTAEKTVPGTPFIRSSSAGTASFRLPPSFRAVTEASVSVTGACFGVPSASVPCAMISFNRSSSTLNTPLFVIILKVWNKQYFQSHRQAGPGRCLSTVCPKAGNRCSGTAGGFRKPPPCCNVPCQASPCRGPQPYLSENPVVMAVNLPGHTSVNPVPEQPYLFQGASGIYGQVWRVAQRKGCSASPCGPG